MPKVDWITWKTDPKEIINPDQIEEDINDCFSQYDSYMNSMVYEQLRSEISKGGLAKDAFNVSGISPANEMSNDIVNAIEEIKHTITTLKEDVRKVASEQKEIEKDQLIEAIEDKLAKEKILLENIETQEGIQDQIRKLGDNPNDIIAIIHDRIKKLTERLEIAKEL